MLASTPLRYIVVINDILSLAIRFLHLLRLLEVDSRVFIDSDLSTPLVKAGAG